MAFSVAISAAPKILIIDEHCLLATPYSTSLYEALKVCRKVESPSFSCPTIWPVGLFVTRDPVERGPRGHDGNPTSSFITIRS